MKHNIVNFGPEFSKAATPLIQFMTEVRRALGEHIGAGFCYECDDFRKTGEVGGVTIPGCEQYFCANPDCPVRKDKYDKFQNFGCPLWRPKREAKA